MRPAVALACAFAAVALPGARLWSAAGWPAGLLLAAAGAAAVMAALGRSARAVSVTASLIVTLAAWAVWVHRAHDSLLLAVGESLLLAGYLVAADAARLRRPEGGPRVRSRRPLPYPAVAVLGTTGIVTAAATLPVASTVAFLIGLAGAACGYALAIGGHPRDRSSAD
jgi:hypothetical protein